MSDKMAVVTSDPAHRVLTINSGSSSLRFALFAGAGLDRVLAGRFERIGRGDAVLTVTDARTQATDEQPVAAPDHVACAPPLLHALERASRDLVLSVIGHRVVHGGPRYSDPQHVDAEMLDTLRALSPFDPEHLPSAIALMDWFAARYPHVPQVACFDTAFHRQLPRVAALLPIPRRYEAQGVRRYGFHGLSYAYLMTELERVAGVDAAHGRVVLAHLGSGASMAAVRAGRCIDTTMAFTPAAGLMMSTRSGDLDPGLPMYLARTEGMSVAQFHDMVNARSGLLGVSDSSADMRDLLQRESEDVRAAEAVAMFCYQSKKAIAALAAALGGIDTLVIAGGIGERAPVVRARICDGLEFLGIALDRNRNATDGPVVSTEASRVTVRVIHTDEELHIARLVTALQSAAPPPTR